MDFRKIFSISVFVSLLVSSVFVPVQAGTTQSLKSTLRVSSLWRIYLHQAPSAPNYYVDADATGAANGLSWADAFTTLQDALAIVIPGDEVWVAEGVYYPDEGAGQIDDDRESTFTILDHVSVIGGFVGTETNRDQSDWAAHITVLSGDLEQNDLTDANGVVTDPANVAGNNAYAVVSIFENSLLDGFYVTAGVSDRGVLGEWGGGVVEISLNPSLSSAGMLERVTIIGNQSDFGGGLCNWGSLLVTDSTIISNTATSYAGWGGGIYNVMSITVTNSIIAYNDAISGGGIANDARYVRASVQLYETEVFSNTAEETGGGIFSHSYYDYGPWYSGDSIIIVDHSAVTDNVAGSYGGGIHNLGLDGSFTMTVSQSVFSGNLAEAGGAIANLNLGGLANINISQSDFIGNQASSDGGAILNWPEGVNAWADISVHQSRFIGNRAAFAGGILNSGNYDGTAVMRITQSLFSNNAAISEGGALVNISYYGASGLYVDQTTFTGNSAETDGGALGIVGAGANYRITNSTISDNTASNNGGGIHILGIDEVTEVQISHTTITGNANGGLTLEGYADPMLVLTMTGNILSSGQCNLITGTVIDGGYNLVEDGGCGFPVAGDLRLAPLSDNGGATPTHALLPDSPAIDSIPADECTISVDQRGEPRSDWACDAGAYEMKFGDGDTVAKSVLVGNSYTFGPTLVKVDVLDDGDCLTGLTVQRDESSHPNATENLQTARYWNITPLGCEQGFDVNLTLPYTFPSSGDDKLCRYVNPGWDCGEDIDNQVAVGPEDMPFAVTRMHVTHLSAWAVGNSVGPTMVSLLSFGNRPPSFSKGLYLSGIILTLFGLILLIVKRKRS